MNFSDGEKQDGCKTEQNVPYVILLIENIHLLHVIKVYYFSYRKRANKLEKSSKFRSR